MGKIVKLLLLSIILGYGTVQAAEKTTLVVKTTINCDHCLQCGSCGQNINDRIRDHNKGIIRVKINTKEHTISVTYRPNKTTPEQIKEAIMAAGFNADGQKADAVAYEALDACCKTK